MENDPRPLTERELRDTEERAQQLADDARGDADLHRHGAEQAPAPGSYPEGLGVHDSPAVHRADHVRREDDVRTADRQEELAETQARTAELLRENAERLERTNELLHAAGDRVQENSGDLQDIRRNTEELQAQLDETARQVREGVRPEELGGDKAGNG
jgi:DNA repair exonuclease SbcCD ATPase subunit